MNFVTTELRKTAGRRGCRKRTVCLVILMLSDIYASIIAVVQSINLSVADQGDHTERDLLLLALTTVSSLATVLWSAFEERAIRGMMKIAQAVRSSVSGTATRLRRPSVRAREPPFEGHERSQQSCTVPASRAAVELPPHCPALQLKERFSPHVTVVR